MTITCTHVLTAKRFAVCADDGAVTGGYWTASLSHMDGVIEVRGEPHQRLSEVIQRTLDERANRRVDDPLPPEDW